MAPLFINLILCLIYLCVIPDNYLISKFSAVVLLVQVFNFDLLSAENTGSLGTVVNILLNMIGLTSIPHVIKTREVDSMNMPLIYVNIAVQIIWLIYSVMIQDTCFFVAGIFSLLFIVIQALFFHWATGNISESNTPMMNAVMKQLVAFFSRFTVQQGLRDINSMFWEDESSEHAQFYMRTYQEDIEQLKEKYGEHDMSYDEHIGEM